MVQILRYQALREHIQVNFILIFMSELLSYECAVVCRITRTKNLPIYFIWVICLAWNDWCIRKDVTILLQKRKFKKYNVNL